MNEANVRKTILKIKEGDYLRFISGFYFERIYFLRIETNEKESIEVGTIKHNADLNTKEFRLDIKKD
jgi:hypothetical protein